MTPEQIYVSLLDEGVDVRRPAPAYRLGGERFVLLRPDDYDPQDETWEFPPGTIVEAERRKTSNGEVLAAVRRVPVASNRSA